MAVKRKTTPSRSSRSWKDINQNVKPKSMSAAARKRLLAQRVRKFALITVAIIVGGFVGRAVLLSEKGPELLAKAGRELPVRNIEIQTDGSITRGWILDYLDLDREEIDLLTLSLVDLKERLTRVPQIRSVEVERKFPDTLAISVSERIPIAKIAAVNKRGSREILTVDEQGLVYSGVNYSKKRLKILPYLDGIRLKRSPAGGFENVSGMDEVAKLFYEASTYAPGIYSSWEVVSLEAMPSVITKSRTARKVIFQPGDYRAQLARLDYILDYYRGNLINPIPVIDLTLGSQVPVQAVLAKR